MADRWTLSEDIFFFQTINAQQLESVHRTHIRIAVQAMLDEQPRNFPGGDLYDQDPWPQRSYTLEGLRARWRRIIAEQEAQHARREAPDEEEERIQMDRATYQTWVNSLKHENPQYEIIEGDDVLVVEEN